MAVHKGKILNRHFRMGAREAHYHHEGIWYHCLTKFPAVYFDAWGFVRFETVEDYAQCRGLNRGQEVNVAKPGICAMAQYQKLQPPPHTLVPRD